MSQSRRSSSPERKRRHADSRGHHRGYSSADNNSKWDDKRTKQVNGENKRPRDREDEERRFRPRDNDGFSKPRTRDRHNHKRQRGEEEDESSFEWGRARIKQEGKNKVKVEKEKPNFQTSGKLTEDVNTVNGIVVKYSEPPEARKPKRRWRLYPFKGDESLPVLYIHRQSAYLIGRERKVADIPVDHPSCSKQHAALQYRLVTFKRENGSEGKQVRPYLIDLGSANGTFINDVKLEPKRYHELMERDVIKFGFSSREYVVLHEHSKDEDLDDDVIEN